jgi:hypothetical protein
VQKKMKNILIAPLLLLGSAFSQVAAPTAPTHLPPVLLPDFDYTQGWLGADDAYSIALDSHKSLWLFGDTFVGARTTKVRSESKTMVRNSVGISVCDDGKSCSMRYFWKHPESAMPRSFFDTGTDDLWYWPLDAFLQGKTLYVSLMAVRNKPKATAADVFGFEIVGTKLATITNPQAPPEKWHIVIQDFTDGHLWPGVSIVPFGNYVIWYTQVSSGSGQGYMTALRIRPDKIATAPDAWEHLSRDGQWKPGLPGDDAMHVIDQPISEMSVRYHPASHKWVALSIGPEFPSPRAVARVADSPVGPWSEPQTVFEFPEMKTTTPGYDKDIFCYAVKEHIELSDANIAMSYTCNSMVVAKVMADMHIYRPKFVILDLPK